VVLVYETWTLLWRPATKHCQGLADIKPAIFLCTRKRVSKLVTKHRPHIPALFHREESAFTCGEKLSVTLRGRHFVSSLSIPRECLCLSPYDLLGSLVGGGKWYGVDVAERSERREKNRNIFILIKWGHWVKHQVRIRHTKWTYRYSITCLETVLSRGSLITAASLLSIWMPVISLPMRLNKVAE